MKNNKTIGVLLLLLALFLGIWLVRSYIPKGNADVKTYNEWWSGLKPDSVTGLTVAVDEKVAALQKISGQWQVGEIPADKETLDELLTNLLEPVGITIVAVTVAQHEQLGVASGSAVLTLKTDTTEKAVRLGNPTTSGRYIRLGDSDTVYLIPKLPAKAASADENDWIDKTITKISEDGMAKLTFNDGNKKLVLVKREGQWYEEGKEMPLDKTVFSAAIASLSSLITQGLVTDEERINYPTGAGVTVTIEKSEGEPVILAFFPGEADALITSSERAGNYRIASSVLENFKISETDLKPMPTPSPTANQ